MKKLAILILALCCAAHGQTVHTYPALDTNNNFTGVNYFTQLVPPWGTYAQMQAWVSPPPKMVWVVTDANALGSCSAGGGTSQAWCVFKNGSWVPLAGNGGGGDGCGLFGVTAGDLCYYDGANYVRLPGNESTQLFLSETTGVPSWQALSGAVSAEDVPTLMTVPSQCHYPSRCTNSDVPFSLIPAPYDYVFKIPPAPVWGSSAIRQDCAVTNSGSPITSSCACTYSQVGSTVTLSCAVPYAYPGDSYVAFAGIICGLSCVPQPTFTSTNGYAFTNLDIVGNSGGLGEAGDAATAPFTGKAPDTVTATFTTSATVYFAYFHLVEVRNATSVDSHAVNGNLSGAATFSSVTTTAADTVILGDSFDNTFSSPGCNYTAGTGYQMISQDEITNGSFGTEAIIEQSASTYTPTITRTGCTVAAGGAFTVAMAYGGIGSGSNIPWLQRFRYSTLQEGGDFGPLVTGDGLFSPDGHTVQPLTFGSGLTLTGSTLSAVANTVTHTCEIVWGGSGSMFALSSGDDAIANQSCLNTLGVTQTITAVQCRSDAGSNTTTVTPTFGATGTGTSICSGGLTCGSSGAYSSTCTVSNAALTSGSNINPVMGGTLTGTSIHMVVTSTASK